MTTAPLPEPRGSRPDPGAGAEGSLPGATSVEAIRIRGFRSLADIQIANLPRAAVLIGANGSGKSNLIRFFEMMSWMLRSRSLAEFITRQGGADDQLVRGSRISPLMDAALSLRTTAGSNEYQFALAYAHPDRLMFVDEAFRFNRETIEGKSDWVHVGSGHTEAKILEFAEADGSVSETARVIVTLLRRCAVYQFHDTSNDSRFKRRCDSTDNSCCWTNPSLACIRRQSA